MPRLPDSRALGERPVPRPIGGLQGTVTYRTPELGQAAHALTNAGANIARVGEHLNEVNERIENARAQARRSAQLHDAMGEFTLEAGKLEIQHARDQDFTTSPKRFDEQIELLRQRVATRVDDEAVRGIFNQKANDLAVTKKLNVINSSLRQEGDYHSATNLKNLDIYAQGAASAQNPAEVATIQGQAEQSVTDLVKSGWITDAEGQRRIKGWGAQVAAARSKNAYAGYRHEFIEGRDNMKRLDALEKRVDGDKDLDEDRRNVLLNSIAGRQDILKHKQEAAYKEYVHGVERSIDKTRATILSGYEPDVKDLDPLVQAAKGNPKLEAEVKQLQGLAEATRKLRLSPPLQQESMLNYFASKVRTNPTAENRELLFKFESIVANQRKEIKKSPLEFAYRQGLAEPVATNLADPVQDPTGLQAQARQAYAMRDSYGAPLTPLLPDQVQQIQAHLGKATTDQKMNWFGSLSMALKPLDDDNAAYTAAVAQLAPDSPVTAHAGDAAGKGRTQAAKLMLAGEAILRPNRKEDGKPDQGKLFPMPPEIDMRREFEARTGNAFAGNEEFRNASYQATIAIYAKLSSDAGDAAGQINSKRLTEATNLAIGNVVKWNGVKTIVPYSMNEGTFTRELDARLKLLKGQYAEGMTPEKAYDLPLYIVGDGRYKLQVSNGFLLDKNGKPLIVDFNQAMPTERSLTKQ